LTPAVARFIDATFLNPSAAQVQAMLASESAEAGGPLLELLFSPDESQQIAIEPMLPDRGIAPAEVALLAQALCRPPLEVAFHLPHGKGRLSAEATPALARRFVSGLKTDRPVPEAVALAIHAAAGRRDGMRLRVAIRNSSVDWTPAKTDALAAYIRRAGSREPDGLRCLEVALEVLAEPGAAADIFAAFAGRKRILAGALERSRRQAGLLARANIETLASGGVRLVAVDEADTRRRMACIDRFTLAAFDRVELSAPMAEEVSVARDPLTAAGLWRALGENGPDSV
jgi:hypothetical protein